MVLSLNARRLGVIPAAALFVLTGPPAHRAPVPNPSEPRCPQPGGGVSPLTLAYQGLATRLPISSAFLLPGDTLDLDVRSPDDTAAMVVRASAGVLRERDALDWRWQAPRTPGTYTIQLASSCGADSMTLHAFVMVPATAVRGGYLNGFRIGRYPAAPARRATVYRPPVGFVEVTPENEDVFVTPHFQLKQFLTKQPGGFPKYVVLDPRLLQKLEYLTGLAQAAGYGRLGFHVMSGYRTPAYNHALGNVEYSRHMYGAAADIFIDEHPRDGVMDDLNHDGRIDIRDAAVLYHLIDRQRNDPAYRSMVGGLAMYPSTASHGPFVHVDVRGYPARW
jgi:hypothetical protein